MREEIRLILNEYRIGAIELEEAIEKLIVILRYRD